MCRTKNKLVQHMQNAVVIVVLRDPLRCFTHFTRRISHRNAKPHPKKQLKIILVVSESYRTPDRYPKIFA